MMSLITLKPLDDGHKAVEIPLGKTTIGRGQFLGCSDKKVSRNHAVLEVTNEGEVFLTPTHVNPCFLKPTDDSPGQILKKDVPCKLENGDTFSLLPKAYRYQLIVGSDSSQNKKCNQEESVKLAGKTNGSALNENYVANKEHDVPEAAFAKEETSDAEKPQDENSSTKKLSEKKKNGETNFSEDKGENDSCELLKKNSSVEEVNLPVDENSVLTIKEKEDGESCAKKELQENISCADVCVNVEDKSVEVTKVLEDDDGCKLHEDPASHDGEEKSETILSGEKTCDSQPVETDVADDAVGESSNELVESEVPDKEAVPPPVVTKTKAESTAQTTKPRERHATKRKAATAETFSKSKGRKKALKMNFEDAKEGTSRQPGRTSSRTNRQTRQGLSLEDFIVSDDDEWQSDQSEPKQRRRNRGVGRKGKEDSGSDWEVEHKKPKKSPVKGWSGSESGSEQSTQRRRKGVKSRRKKEKPEEKDLNEVLSEDPSSSGAVTSKTRIPCSFGKKCFRRNAQHKEQFSHPGDSDYLSETETKPKNNDAISESEDEAPKKECPYGANCFRKNPQHKKDFKHTKNVRPQREAAKQADKKAKSSRSSDGIDSYDLNDSFLNDDSADEYKPVDSGSDYENGEKLKKLTKVKGNKSKRGKKL